MHVKSSTIQNPAKRAFSQPYELPKAINKGWKVTFAGTGVNLALGILYSWSIIAGFLRDNMGWSAFNTQLPYMIACGVFALLMVPGGRIQDQVGPRKVIMAAALLAGVGFVGSSYVTSPLGLSIFFGLFFGAAIGLGYSSTTPPAMKWFGSNKRGLITGIVVSGFGLASVYSAPLANSLIQRVGLSQTFFIIGIAFFILILILAQFIKNPPPGYVPPGASRSLENIPAEKKKAEKKKVSTTTDFEWHEMCKTPQFYVLWFMFCFGSLAGLMIIGQLSSIAREQSGIALGFILVAILAIFNAGGRISGGIMFDSIGATKTLFIIFSLQAVNFLLFGIYNNLYLLLIGTVIAGFCYGACLSVFPSITANLFGVKNLGINYGLIFTAWGAGGVFGGLLGGMVRDATGTYLYAYLAAAALCFLGAILIFFLKLPESSAVRKPETATE